MARAQGRSFSWMLHASFFGYDAVLHKIDKAVEMLKRGSVSYLRNSHISCSIMPDACDSLF